METLSICENKMMLTLNGDDALLLTGKRDPEPGALIGALMPMLRNVGFRKENERIRCDIFEFDGSYSIFFAKDGDDFTRERGHGGMKSETDGLITEIIDTRHDYIYEFSDLEDLLSVCKEISAASSVGAKVLYDGDKTYLCLRSPSPVPSEFSAKECSAAESAAVKERSRALPYSTAELGALSKASYRTKNAFYGIDLL